LRSGILDNVEVLALWDCWAMIQKIAGIVKDFVGYDPIFAVLNSLQKTIRWIENILNAARETGVICTDSQILKLMDRKIHK